MYDKESIASKRWVKVLVLYLIKFKKKCFFLDWTLNMWFEYIIYFFIMLSMFMLIIDNPMIDPTSDIAVVKNNIDNVTTIVFIVEAIFRIIALGFISGSVPQRKAYIQTGSN